MKLFFGVFLLSLLATSGELMRSSPSQPVDKTEKTESSVYTKYDPFFESCKKTDLNKKIIPVEAISPLKFGVPQIVQNDKKGNTAFDLINETYKYTQSVLKNNLENTKKSLNCVDEIFDKKLTDVKLECQSTLQDVMNSSLANQRARYELAMALPDSKVLNETQFRTLNTDLNIPINTFKSEKWNPLNDREKKVLSETWSVFLIDIEKQAKEKMPANFSFTGPSVTQQYKLDLIAQKRKSALLNYHLQMTKYPLVQFIKTDDPQKNDFKKAYESVIQNIEKEIENIKTKQNKLVLNSAKEISSDDLFILNYQTTENILAANPEYCSIAQSLMEFQKKKQMYYSGGILTVMLGASLSGKVPAAAIFTAGSALSGLGTYNAYVKYKESMQANLASPVYDDQIFRKVKVDANKQAFVLDGTMAIALGLPNPIKLGQYLKQTAKISEAQMAKYFESEQMEKFFAPVPAGNAATTERAQLLAKINSIEKQMTEKSVDSSMLEKLKKTGRGVGEKIIFSDESGQMAEGQVLRHVYQGQHLFTVISQEVIKDGKKKLVKVTVPAHETVPSIVPDI